jgi:outer membrane protein insertion porin family
MSSCDTPLRGHLPALTALGKGARGLLALSMAIGAPILCRAQAAPASPAPAQRGVASLPQSAPSSDLTPPPVPAQEGLQGWAGLRVTSIRFDGVNEATLKPLPGQLAQQPGEALDPMKVRDSLRRLYATGLYATIEVSGIRTGNEVSIIYSGVPRIFIRRVNVNGVKNDRLAAILQGSTQLQAGTAYTPAKVAQANTALESALESNGFYAGKVSSSTSLDAPNSLIDLNYQLATGQPARIGNLEIVGQSGLTEQQFRKHGKLKINSKVNRNTVSRALSSLHKNYAKKGHLAAAVSLTSKDYVPAVNHLNMSFVADEGPTVDVRVEGAKIKKGTLTKLMPVYEEGAIDQDLLNEGAQNLRNHYQGQGYFDAQVSHGPAADEGPDQPLLDSEKHITALYNVKLGPKHVVDSVAIAGNKYFSKEIIDKRISVRPSNIIDRHGSFSQQLMDQDVGSIKALYQSNGFSSVTVTPKVVDSGPGRNSSGEAHLRITYLINEGVQQRIGKYEITGADPGQLAQFRPSLSLSVGQPYSSVNLNQDRDLVLTHYLSHGFDNAVIELVQETEPGNKGLVDVTMKVTEGPRFFVRQVLVSGIHFTRPAEVQRQIRMQPGDPLNQTELLEMQRRLYDLALFNEVNTAIQNPEGTETYKNVLLNLTEAKRWDINYGFGFEAQTGTPTQGCLSIADQILLGIINSYKCSPNGRLGASPRILFSISRTNLGGTDQSITLRTNYGTLEQLALLTYQDPHVFRRRSLNLSLSGGYNNSANISTYQASVLSASLRFSQRVNKANNLIYSFSYRRVSVNPNTLQVSLAEIPLLAQPVRVGGPGLSWIRDTRDVPLDAHHGTFTSLDEFVADGHFGSQANFDRLDVTNATYYDFGRDHWVIARQTRYGQERAYGAGDEETIPLPERLYAGGATSHRGFVINAAGPRDPQTGYPIGGSGVFVNTLELRTPAPNLPYLGNSLSFALFHDMGNVFEKSSDIWPSFFRIKQPHSGTCRNVSVPYTTYNTADTCDFNDFSHAVGMGLRYRTPIGPIRADFAYNLNPPIYPVIYDYTTNSSTANPHVGQAEHFNFFFSIGQSF